MVGRAEQWTTDSEGSVELLAPAGTHHVLVRHPVLGGDESVELCLQSLRVVETLAGRASVLFFLLPIAVSEVVTGTGPRKHNGDIEPPKAAAVWICSQSSHLPSGARPFRGKLRIRRLGGFVREVVLDENSIIPVDLEDKAHPVRTEDHELPPVPVVGVAVEVDVDNAVAVVGGNGASRGGVHFWVPAQKPWLLSAMSEWDALLAAPVRAGDLLPPVTLKLHGFGATSGELRFPASEFRFIGDIITSLAHRLCEGSDTCGQGSTIVGKAQATHEQLSIFEKRRQLALHEVVRPWSVLDVWPLATVQVHVRASCCGRRVRGVRVRLNEDYDASGAPSSALLEDFLKPGVRVRVRSRKLCVSRLDQEERLLRTPEAQGGIHGVATKVDKQLSQCEVHLLPAWGEVDTNCCRVFRSNELEVTDPLRIGFTDEKGTCSLITIAGGRERLMYLDHPLFEDTNRAELNEGCICRSVRVLRGVGAMESLTVDPAIFVYMTASDRIEAADPATCAADAPLARTAAASASKSVWACTRLASVPEDAEPVHGALLVGRGDGCVGIPLRGPRLPLRLPKACRWSLNFGDSGQMRCFLGDVTLDVLTDRAGFVWCPEGGTGTCEQLLTGEPVLVGAIRPAVTVRCHDLSIVARPRADGDLISSSVAVKDKSDLPEVLQLPIAGDTTIGVVRRRVAQKFGLPVADVGISRRELVSTHDEVDCALLTSSASGVATVTTQTASGSVGSAALAAAPLTCGDGEEVRAGQTYEASVLARLIVRVEVPEGVMREGLVCAGPPHFALPGVAVKLDGELGGATDAFGVCELRARVGRAATLHLSHPCFGSQVRELPGVNVEYGQHSERLVLADVRIHVFASQGESVKVDSRRRANASGQIRGGGSGALSVWVAASPEHIARDVVPVELRVSGKDAHGKEVSQTLEPGVTEFCLLWGAECEVGSRCTLASLKVEASKLGYCWSEKDPSPLADRAEKLGGSEFVRLVSSPVHVGSLEPAFQVVFSDDSRPPSWIRLSSCSTAGKLKRHLAINTGLPAAEMMLFRVCWSEVLDDADLLDHGSTITVSMSGFVRLTLISGCCYTPLHGVGVVVDGIVRGVTDGDGSLSGLVLAVGTRRLEFDHTALKRDAETVQDIRVERGPDNEFTFVVDPHLHFYATELDVPEEVDSSPADIVGAAYMAAAAPSTEPVCVWVAADRTQIPDDAQALSGGRVMCCDDRGVNVRKELADGKIEPVTLRIDKTIKSSVGESDIADDDRQCLLASLRVSCRRSGYAWCPKDPSPLAAGAAELGGCQFLRVITCPVSLGCLKPATIVYCARGQRIEAPLDEYGELAELRRYLVKELGGELRPEDLLLEAVGDSVFDVMLPNATLPLGLEVLCAVLGEEVSCAREARRIFIEEVARSLAITEES
eukprot:TRINITY_DN38511_c0_g2_i1.p1 TRINITY_DN38511_c0_g2~~TRINITY_DN38511_c0_g2_i1.p1  ORF type:complete len:1554 (-),score=282.36 TRINITY_DN38511_c0_g2_i1:204-4421(-)